MTSKELGAHALLLTSFAVGLIGASALAVHTDTQIASEVATHITTLPYFSLIENLFVSKDIVFLTGLGLVLLGMAGIKVSNLPFKNNR